MSKGESVPRYRSRKKGVVWAEIKNPYSNQERGRVTVIGEAQIL